MKLQFLQDGPQRLVEGLGVLGLRMQGLLYSPAGDQQLDAPVPVFYLGLDGKGYWRRDGVPAVDDRMFTQQDDLAVSRSQSG